MSTSMQKKKSPKVIKREFILRKSSKLKKVHTNGQGSIHKFGILKRIPNLRLENISDGDNSLDPIRSRKAYRSGKSKKA